MAPSPWRVQYLQPGVTYLSANVIPLTGQVRISQGTATHTPSAMKIVFIAGRRWDVSDLSKGSRSDSDQTSLVIHRLRLAHSISRHAFVQLTDSSLAKTLSERTWSGYPLELCRGIVYTLWQRTLPQLPLLLWRHLPLPAAMQTAARCWLRTIDCRPSEITQYRTRQADVATAPGVGSYPSVQVCVEAHQWVLCSSDGSWWRQASSATYSADRYLIHERHYYHSR